MTTATMIDRDTAILRIRKALKVRSGKAWSVTGGRGTAWGWIEIDAPPRRRTWQDVATAETDPMSGLPVYAEVNDPDHEFGHMGPDDRTELARLLGLETVHFQGVSIPSGSDYREEYVARAEGREPERFGERYWD